MCQKKFFFFFIRKYFAKMVGIMFIIYWKFSTFYTLQEMYDKLMHYLFNLIWLNIRYLRLTLSSLGFFLFFDWCCTYSLTFFLIHIINTHKILTQRNSITSLESKWIALFLSHRHRAMFLLTPARKSQCHQIFFLRLPLLLCKVQCTVHTIPLGHHLWQLIDNKV